jgi:hypothetical protein
MTAAGRLLAISDLHVAYPENRAHVDALRPGHDDDWLLVAGDVAERVDDVGWALRTLAGRFATVVWAPGNHELWTSPREPASLRGVARYELVVAMWREIGVHTPEEPYPRCGGMTSLRRPPTFMPTTPRSQPAITWPPPSWKLNGWRRFQDESNSLPVECATPT